MKVFLFVVFFVFPASANFTCEVDDKNIKFSIDVTTKDNFFDDLLDSAKGEIQLSELFADFDIPSISLSAKNIQQYWNSNNQLNFRIYSEITVEPELIATGLTVQTKKRGEVYSGTYQLIVSNSSPLAEMILGGPVVLDGNGRITCRLKQ
jgi:hypothetical protein